MAFEVTTMSDADRQAWQSALGVPGIARVVISSSEILNLRASPKLLIAAPGAGKFITVTSAHAILKFGTAAYTLGGSCLLQYGSPGIDNGQGEWQFSGGNSFLEATEDYLYAAESAGQARFASSFIMNQGIYLAKMTREFTTGDGTALIIVNYSIETMP